MTLKKIFLWVVLASLAMAAVMGTLTIWNHGDSRWLGTMLTVALFANLALAAAGIIEKRVWRRAMAVVVVLAALATVQYLVRIWSDWDYGSFRENYEKGMFLSTMWIFAVLLGGYLATIDPGNWVRVVRRIEQGFVFGLAGFMTYGIVSEFDDVELGRIIGVLAVITGLGAVGVPILNRMHGIEKKERVETAGREMTIVCPRCLKQQVVRAGESRCSGCRLKFTIEIEEPRCPKCDYLLYRLESARCPECGEVLGEGEVGASIGTGDEGTRPASGAAKL